MFFFQEKKIFYENPMTDSGVLKCSTISLNEAYVKHNCNRPGRISGRKTDNEKTTSKTTEKNIYFENLGDPACKIITDEPNS